jgi:hypothetical protein
MLLQDFSTFIIVYISINTYPNKSRSQTKVFIHFLKPAFLLCYMKFYLCKKTCIKELTECMYVFLTWIFYFNLNFGFTHHNEILRPTPYKNSHEKDLL